MISSANILNYLNKKNINTFVWFGLLLILSYYVPYFILKENSYVIIHDNLDSEFVYKVIASRFPFEKKYDIIMNGLPSFCLPSKISITQLFYYFLPPFYAYLINDILVKIIAFIGMFFLIDNYIFIKRHRYIIFLISFSFCVIPFYSIFGLSSAGIPLLLFCFLEIFNKSNTSILIYFYIFIYSFFSSFALVGLFIITILAFFLFTTRKMINKSFILSFFLITFGYILSEHELFYSFISGFESHRTQWKINFISLNDNLKYLQSIFFATQYHTGKFYTYLILITFLFVIISRYRNDQEYKQSKLERLTLKLMCFIYIICFIYPYLQYYFGDKIKIIIAFDFTRFYFFTPCLWFILFAYTIKYFIDNKLIYTSLIIIIFNFALIILNDSIYTHNFYSFFFKKSTKNDLRVFKNYFDTNLFKQVSDFIDKPQNTYRIINLGFSPSISQYNGFYTIDSYQNVYPLFYKKEFRNIISSELNKNNDWKNYFDDWGSRLYLYTLPLPFESDHLKLDINISALKKFNCNYILSTKIIDNFDSLHLKLIKSFVNTNTYTIHLYELE